MIRILTVLLALAVSFPAHSGCWDTTTTDASGKVVHRGCR